MDLKELLVRHTISWDVSYRMLTEVEIDNLDLTLDNSRVLISHVGDGEYSYNVFGNVFSSYKDALQVYDNYCSNVSHTTLDMHSVRHSYVMPAIIEYTWHGDTKDSVKLYLGWVRLNYDIAEDQRSYDLALASLLTVVTINGRFSGGS